MDRNNRRKYGQNFLARPEIAAELLEDLPYSRKDHILEIGPGHGAMTRVMLPRCEALTAVEIDEECVKYLHRKFRTDRRLTLVNKSFLDFDLATYLKETPKPWVVGNLPYNVATPIITRIFPYLAQVRGMMFMVQYEVAKRLCADPGCSDYGFLTVLLRSWGKATLLQKVHKENFRPRPNVMSATLMIKHDPEATGISDDELKFVYQSFSQKRKRISNSLKDFYPKSAVNKALEQMELGENTRAEELSPDKFKELYKILNIKKD